MWSDYRIVKSRSAHKKRRESLFLIFAILFIVICFDADRLVVVAKVFAKECTAATIGSIFWDFKFKGNITVVVDIEFLYSHVGKLVGAVHKATLTVDN